MAYQGWSDFRSDTVTRPTPEMRRAMAEAEVGDDVLGDDPTVKRLQEMGAAIMGKPEALYVPSGTMGNTLALMAYGCRGKEVLLEEKCHILNFEAGNISNLVGAIPHPIRSLRGTMEEGELAAGIRPPGNMHSAPSAGICLENSHNYHGGAVMTVDYMAKVHQLAKHHDLFLHLDGARIFNAATAMGAEPKMVAAHCDSLMFCLSKGLCAPVGSLLAGPAPFIQTAHRLRKQLGGAMRQVGVLAAAGIVALTQMVERLAEDHARARRLADGIAALPGLAIDPKEAPTNIVIFQVTHPSLTAEGICESLRKEGVLSMPFGPGRIRMVTHHDVDDADVERALTALGKIAAGAR